MCPHPPIRKMSHDLMTPSPKDWHKYRDYGSSCVRVQKRNFRDCRCSWVVYYIIIYFFHGVGTKCHTPNLSLICSEAAASTSRGLQQESMRILASIFWGRSQGPDSAWAFPYLRTAPKVIQGREAQVWGRGSWSWDTVSNLFTVYLPWGQQRETETNKITLVFTLQQKTYSFKQHQFTKCLLK